MKVKTEMLKKLATRLRNMCIPLNVWTAQAGTYWELEAIWESIQ